MSSRLWYYLQTCIRYIVKFGITSGQDRKGYSFPLQKLCDSTNSTDLEGEKARGKMTAARSKLCISKGEIDIQSPGSAYILDTSSPSRTKSPPNSQTLFHPRRGGCRSVWAESPTLPPSEQEFEAGPVKGNQHVLCGIEQQSWRLDICACRQYVVIS